MKTNLKELFSNIEQKGAFTKMHLDNCVIGVYYGIFDDLPSLAFRTKRPAGEIVGTQYLEVLRIAEADQVYWLRFNLKLPHAEEIFYSLGESLIEAALEFDVEWKAILSVCNRYQVWRKMFRKAFPPMSEEQYKGLMGELYYLKHYMIPRLGKSEAIHAWTGPQKTAKDFSYSDTWSEIKTTSISSEIVTITSLGQLESESNGHLIIIRLESMSKEYDDGESTVGELISSILNELDLIDDKEYFLNSVKEYGYGIGANEDIQSHYRVSDVSSYLVDNSFPKITTKNVPYPEIIRVSYGISINSIQGHLEVL